MSSRLKLAGICIAAAFALAACGGGGGTATPPPVVPDPAIQQRADINSAITTADDAVGMVNDDASDATVTAAETAITAARTAITNAANVPAQERTAFTGTVDVIEGRLDTAKMSRQTAMNDAQKAADAAMAVTASKLYAGIGATPLTGHAVTVDATSGAWSVDPAAVGTTDLANQVLTADEDTMVPANHGWTGMRHTASGDGVEGTYEAVVYSHPDAPTVTEGAAFNVAYPLDGTTGETATLDTSTAALAGRVASPSFDQDAGLKAFKPGENDIRIMLAGSYHGVSGMYYCTPTDRAVGCTADVADMGFTLAGGTWTFKPTVPTTALMDTSADDTEYASYGWWLHKAANDGAFAASAFAVYRGTAPTVDIAALRGTATYTGGAAGKYSLRGDTGGTNDAGHFTADVTLEATFAAVHSISGTIDNFVGADGEDRDWSVALGKSIVAGGGAITGGLNADGTADTNNTGNQMTTWTIGGTAGAAAGEWSGNLHEEGDDGVPAIATGTFSSTYGQNGNDGRMVGAFGANE